ncbi:chorismate-binding protein [Clostridium saccharobutylicum]|uniref:Isochorismate synthase EntC n=1 Tax=Clostridium saccharobutylicum TaxID=169679 RepID=A0A1S8MTG5_CLOSA|nr:chorismate-binding protein [Clostridium saccharobutylicum]OOM07471.1 isochorismate synthase EntC [Clostridium saccharobutylicum]
MNIGLSYDKSNYVKRTFKCEFNLKNEFESTFKAFEKSNIDKVKVKDYKSAFLSKNLDEKQMNILAIGNYFSFKVFANKNKIIVNYYKYNELINTKEYNSGLGCSYKDVFSTISTAFLELKHCVNEICYDVPLLGGWKSITFDKKIKEVACFYLPEVVVYGQEGEYKLFSTCGEIIDILKNNNNQLDCTFESELKSYECIPSKEIYRLNYDILLNALTEGKISKYVLSRKYLLNMQENIDSIKYAGKVIKNYYQEYGYYFQLGGAEEWIGVSPEVLLKKKDNYALTKPLAGTIKKDFNDKEGLLAKKLLSDKKENVEHMLAVDLMINDLKESNVGEVNVLENKQIIETPYVYHLKSKIEVKVKKHNVGFDILANMYPPATVWGIPRDAAEEFINKVEPFDREYFTGGFGYCTLEDNSNFALVIRSCMIKNNEMHVYAGSGIVNGAVPDNEWEETKLKATPFLSLFDL